MTDTALKAKRATVEATEEMRKMYEELKLKGYNFSTISYHAILEAIKNKMEVPQKENPNDKGFKAFTGVYIGISIPLEIADDLDKLTKPTAAKAAYIREAIKRYVDNKNLI